MRVKYQDVFVDGNGRVVSGGTVTVYVAETSTLKSIYTTETGTTPITGSFVTTATDGSFSFWVTNDYPGIKLVMSKTNYVSATYDNILPGGGGGIGCSECEVWVDDYGAAGDGVTDDSAAINLAIAALSATKGGIVRFCNKDYRFNITITTPNVWLKGAGGQWNIYQQPGRWMPYNINLPVIKVYSATQNLAPTLTDFCMYSGGFRTGVAGTEGIKLASGSYGAKLDNFTIWGFTTYQLHIGDSVTLAMPITSVDISRFHIISASMGLGHCVQMQAGLYAGEVASYITGVRFNQGLISNNWVPAPGHYAGTNATQLSGPNWAAGITYELNDTVLAVDDHNPDNSTSDWGWIFRCTTAGTSHPTTEPTWNVGYGVTTDELAPGTAKWTCTQRGRAVFLVGAGFDMTNCYIEPYHFGGIRMDGQGYWGTPMNFANTYLWEGSTTGVYIENTANCFEPTYYIHGNLRNSGYYKGYNNKAYSPAVLDYTDADVIDISGASGNSPRVADLVVITTDQDDPNDSPFGRISMGGSNLTLDAYGRRATSGSLMQGAIQSDGWTCTNGWSVSSATLVKAAATGTGTATAIFRRGIYILPTIGVTYYVTIVASAASGTISYTMGGAAGTNITAAGTTSDTLTATSTAPIIFSGGATDTCTITSISIISNAPDACNIVFQQYGLGDVVITGGAYNQPHLVLGAYHLWIDGSGKLRLNATNPTTASDGGQLVSSYLANGSYILTNTLTVTSGPYAGLNCSLDMRPSYTAAVPVAVTHYYFDLYEVGVAGSATHSGSYLLLHDKLPGTSKMVDAATTKTTPGGVDGWIKVYLDSAEYFIPVYLSKTA